MLPAVELNAKGKPFSPSSGPKQAVSWVKVVSAFVHSVLNVLVCPRAAMDKVVRIAKWKRILHMKE